MEFCSWGICIPQRLTVITFLSGKFWFLFSCFNFTKIEKEQSFCEKRNSKANIEVKQLCRRARNSEQVLYKIQLGCTLVKYTFSWEIFFSSFFPFFGQVWRRDLCFSMGSKSFRSCNWIFPTQWFHKKSSRKISKGPRGPRGNSKALSPCMSLDEKRVRA